MKSGWPGSSWPHLYRTIIIGHAEAKRPIVTASARSRRLAIERYRRFTIARPRGASRARCSPPAWLMAALDFVRSVDREGALAADDRAPSAVTAETDRISGRSKLATIGSSRLRRCSARSGDHALFSDIAARRAPPRVVAPGIAEPCSRPLGLFARSPRGRLYPLQLLGNRWKPAAAFRRLLPRHPLPRTGGGRVSALLKPPGTGGDRPPGGGAPDLAPNPLGPLHQPLRGRSPSPSRRISRCPCPHPRPAAGGAPDADINVTHGRVSCALISFMGRRRCCDRRPGRSPETSAAPIRPAPVLDLDDAQGQCRRCVAVPEGGSAFVLSDRALGASEPAARASSCAPSRPDYGG